MGSWENTWKGHHLKNDELDNPENGSKQQSQNNKKSTTHDE